MRCGIKRQRLEQPKQAEELVDLTEYYDDDYVYNTQLYECLPAATTTASGRVKSKQSKITPMPLAAAHNLSLVRNGVCLVKAPIETISIYLVDRVVRDILENQPELRQPALTGVKNTADAFGAASTPSCFHDPRLHTFRAQLFPFIRKVLRKEYGDFSAAKKDMYVQMVMDRVVERWKGERIASESWHQDCSIDDRTDAKVDVYNTMYNISDSVTQYFSCIIDTHLEGRIVKDTKDGSSGFMRFHEQKGRQDPKYRMIPIPPGYILVFNELLVHEVLPGKIKTTHYHIHTKFIVSDSAVSCWLPRDQLTALLTRQAVMPLQYLQGKPEFPSLYPALYDIHCPEKRAAFSERFIDACLLADKCIIRDGAIFPSLVEMGRPFFAYTEEQIRMYTDAVKF